MANNNHFYSDRQARLDTIIGQTTALSVNKYEHWRTLIQAKDEYDRQHPGQTVNIDTFYAWLEETYGIRLQKVDGMIDVGFDIVDKHKYLIYRLKFE